MPTYFTEYVPKGRNFKICSEYPNSNICASNVINSSLLYEYLEKFHYKLYFVSQFVGCGIEESEISEAREYLAAYCKDLEFLPTHSLGCDCCMGFGEGDGEGGEGEGEDEY